MPTRAGSTCWYRFGIDADRAGVQARLVGERRHAGVRLARRRRVVGDLGDRVGDARGLGQLSLGQHRHAELQLEVGDGRDEVGVAGALAVPVDAALQVGGAGQHGRHRVGDRAAGVVVGVDAETRAGGHHVGDDLADLVRQHAAVRVAEDDDLRTGLGRGADDLQRVVAVVEVAVEEVLAVDEHALTLGAQVLDGVAHHREVLLQRRAQRELDVLVVALRHQRHDRGAGLTQRGDESVVGRRTVRAPGGAERRERGVLQVELLRRQGEELGVLRVGAGPAALDVADAEVVEVARDVQLVLHGEVEPLLLRAVAHRRVVHVEVAHVLSVLRPLVCPSSGLSASNSCAHKKAPQAWEAARRVWCSTRRACR